MVSANCQLKAHIFSTILKDGGAIYGDANKYEVAITRSVFVGNSAPNGDGGSLYISTGKSMIKMCKFMTRGRGGGASTNGKLVITESLFSGNHAVNGGSAHISPNEGLIKNCNFTGNKASISGGAILARTKTKKNTRNKLVIMKSSFIGNQAKEGGSLDISIDSTVVEKCTFVDSTASTFGGAIQSSGTSPYFLKLKDSTFHRCSAGNQGGVAAITGDCEFRLLNSTLVNNRARVAAGGIFMATESTEKSSCIIEQSSFVNCSAPSISLRSYNIEVMNTSFDVTDSSPAPHIELEGEHVLLKAIHANVNYPDSAQSNVIQKVISAVSQTTVNVSNGIDIFCSSDFNVEVKSDVPAGSRGLKAEIRCQTCPPGMYTLTNKLHLRHLSDDIPKCASCPSGAVCDGQIKVLDNYWGTRVGDELNVMPCPVGYCCSSRTTPCTSYNTCAESRTGTLCGTCDNNHVQSYMRDECVPREVEQCNISIFVAYFFIGSLIYTIALTFPQSIIILLKQIWSRFRKSSSENTPENCVISEDIELSYGAFVTLVIYYLQLASLVHIDVLKNDAGPQEAGSSGREISKVIFDILNFKATLQNNVCPTEQLDMIGKLLINMALKLTTLLHLVWILLVWKFVVLVKSCRSRKQDQPDKSDTTVAETSLAMMDDCESADIESIVTECTEMLPFSLVVKIGVVKLMKLNFTSAVNILFQLIHCERIGNQLHLYLYGDYVCYGWWQVLIIVVLLPIVVLFPLSFGISLNLLKERRITSSSFLVMCGMPLATVWFQVKKMLGTLEEIHHTKHEERCMEEILLLEEELYRPSNEEMRWPVIQLYRNLLVVVLDIFILNREYKILWLAVLFVAFSLHDRYRMPFKHEYMNQLQRLTSACLFLITL